MYVSTVMLKCMVLYIYSCDVAFGMRVLLSIKQKQQLLVLHPPTKKLNPSQKSCNPALPHFKYETFVIIESANNYHG
jgi:hypothetical protein